MAVITLSGPSMLPSIVARFSRDSAPAFWCIAEYVYVTLAVLTAVAAPERFVLEAALVSALAVGQSEVRLPNAPEVDAAAVAAGVLA